MFAFQDVREMLNGYTEIDLVDAHDVQKRFEEGWELIAVLGMQEVHRGSTEMPWRDPNQYENQYANTLQVLTRNRFMMGRTDVKSTLQSRLEEAQKEVDDQKSLVGTLKKNAKEHSNTIEAVTESRTSYFEKNRELSSRAKEAEKKLDKLVAILGTQKVDELLAEDQPDDDVPF